MYYIGVYVNCMFIIIELTFKDNLINAFIYIKRTSFLNRGTINIITVYYILISRFTRSLISRHERHA